ncbi:hypothetical protein ACO1PF_10420 [Alkalibacterium sp. f15]|uniref:hypothetical protein n=1 Tax=Alkalibacterium sp. f15 TaxID=3414029 RepID=UPI003BF87E56
MKKIITKSILVFGSLLVFTGCGNQTDSAYSESIQNGLDSLIAEDYDKAEVYFELVKNEYSDDERANNLYIQIQSFKEAIEYLEAGDIEESRVLATEVTDMNNSSIGLTHRSSNLLILIDEIEENRNVFLSNYTEALSLFEEEDYEEANNLLSLNADDILSNELYYSDILKDSQELTIAINKKIDQIATSDLKAEEERIQLETEEQVIKEAKAAEQKKNDEAKAKAEAEEEASQTSDSGSLSMSVEEYRNQVWYGYDEDPNFTYNDALAIIKNVVGPEPEDESFYYNGRLRVSINDSGIRSYTLWKEANTGEGTADATFAVYDVYEDNTVFEH